MAQSTRRRGARMVLRMARDAAAVAAAKFFNEVTGGAPSQGRKSGSIGTCRCFRWSLKILARLKLRGAG